MSPSKSALQYGALFGILMVLEFVIVYVMDVDPISNPAAGIIINTLNYLVFPVSIITISCMNYKKNLNNGFISFGECLKIGVTICLIAGLIYGVFSAVFRGAPSVGDIVPEIDWHANNVEGGINGLDTKLANRSVSAS